MDTTPKRCSRCVLPSNYPGITFDEKQICNYCHQVKKPELLGEDKFLETIGRYRNGPGKYDCMVALSGGRDSSYVLWYAVKKLGLKTLACCVDNGFVPEQTMTNVKTATEILGVDLVVKKHDLVTNCIRHTLKSWMRKPTPGMIGVMCAGCTLGLRIGLLETATEYEVPMMLYGIGEPEQSFAEKYMSYNENSKITKRSLALGFITEITLNPTYLLSPRSVITYAKEFLFRWSGSFQRWAMRKIQPTNLEMVFPFYYMEWDEDKILSVIKDELQWKRCEYTENTWRADCTIAMLKNYLYDETVGFSKVEELLSNLVRLKMITREDAIERLKHDSVVSDDLVTELFDKLDLDTKAMQKALLKAKKSRYYLKVD